MAMNEQQLQRGLSQGQQRQQPAGGPQQQQSGNRMQQLYQRFMEMDQEQLAQLALDLVSRLNELEGQPQQQRQSQQQAQPGGQPGQGAGVR